MSQSGQPSFASRVGGFFTGVGRSIADDIGSTFQGLVGQAYGLVSSPIQTLYGLATGNFDLAGQGLLNFGKSLVPRYGNFAGPNWPGGNQLTPFANQVDQGAFVHDRDYGRLPSGASRTPADLALIRNAWTGRGIQPGPVGQVYRILLTAGFGAKVGVQSAFGF